MILKQFYAEDENIITASYSFKRKEAEIVVDPFLHHDSDDINLFTSVKLPVFRIKCSEFEFNMAFKSLEEHLQKS